MNEPQLIEDLRVALDDATARLDAPPHAAERARARGRRRRATRGLLAGVPAVALAAGLVVAVAAHGGATATGATGATASKPPVETVAYVTEHVDAALANADKYIIRTTQRYLPGSADTQWSDPRTGSIYMVQGAGSSRQLSWESTFYSANVLHWRETDVNDARHTWSTYVMHASGTSAPSTGPSVPGGSPAQVQQWLKTGTFRIVGHGYVNGHHATELRADLGPIDMEIWVDSKTFQVVRTIKSFTGGLKGNSIIENDSWLPRPAALVNLINHPQIPAGFTRVPAPK
ncbi:MAG TPA: hypothetical protein VMV07_15550 [Streptosporangiaceae bacterium]|nr:hypothetical protein [Streptosporangiaceae bacterium]